PTNRCARPVPGLAMDRHRAMRPELARLGARRAEAHPIDDVIQPRFEKSQQVLAGRSLALRGHREIALKLPFEHAVRATQLLLLAELLAVVGHPHPRFHAVLPRLRVELAFGIERAARALEEQVRSFAARELAFGSEVSSYYLSLSAKSKNLLL